LMMRTQAAVAPLVANRPARPAEASAGAL